ncbi:MAG: hypothetical protein IT422_03195 [Pirellulaceae bacterium]|nr:hypothetical protein [Pirellulaceae bacterium]
MHKIFLLPIAACSSKTQSQWSVASLNSLLASAIRMLDNLFSRYTTSAWWSLSMTTA